MSSWHQSDKGRAAGLVPPDDGRTVLVELERPAVGGECVWLGCWTGSAWETVGWKLEPAHRINVVAWCELPTVGPC